MTYGGSLPDWYTFFKENRGVLPMYLIFSSLAFFGNKKDALSWRRPTLPLRVPSALVSLTAVFGMGTGVPSPQQPPRHCVFLNFSLLVNSTTLCFRCALDLLVHLGSTRYRAYT